MLRKHLVSVILFFSLTFAYIMISVFKDKPRTVASVNGFMDNLNTSTPFKDISQTVVDISVPSNDPHPLLLSIQQKKSLECPEKISLDHFGDYWINISSSRDIFVYSAYLDERKVRIIGIKQGRADIQLFCKIWYKDNTVSEAPMQWDLIPEDHGKRYSAAYFLCPLSGLAEPFAVSVMVENTTRCTVHTLPVINTFHPKPSERNFSICLAPLNCNYSRVYELIEWIELNLLMGVQYFTLYKYSIAENIQHVLTYYSKRGLVEVLPWNIPISVREPEEIHYFAQLAALNDCLYRNRHKTKLLAIIDLDEFIIPRKPEDLTWLDMFSSLPDSSSYIFRNTFYRANRQNIKLSYQFLEKAHRYKLKTLETLQRDTYIYPMNWRSKVIVKPTAVVTVGIHNIWEHTKGTSYGVETENGLLHHYRFWNYTEERYFQERDKTGTKDSYIDETILKYKDALIKHVENTWTALTGLDMGLPKSSLHTGYKTHKQENERMQEM